MVCMMLALSHFRLGGCKWFSYTGRCAAASGAVSDFEVAVAFVIASFFCRPVITSPTWRPEVEGIIYSNKPKLPITTAGVL